VTDPGDNESGSRNVAITVNAFSPPSISAPGSAAVVLNGSLAFSSANGNAITVADSGPGSSSDSLTLTVTHGTVTLATTSGLTITGGANGTATVTVKGAIANLNAALSGLTYKPTTGYTGSDSLAISLADSVDTLSANASVALTISNSPPSITAPATASDISPGTLVFSTAKNNAITIKDQSAGSTVEPLTITVNNGSVALASTSGITFTSGSNGSSSMAINGTLTNLNNALNGLIFSPARTGTATIVLSYTDLATGLKASATITITVSTLPRLNGTTPSGGGATASPSLTTSSTDDTSMPPDALTQWQGVTAAVEVLNG
jgi:large repetitive protein